MARAMKTVVAPKRERLTILVTVDPLAVARGHRALPRGGAHATDRRPSRARAKREARRQFAEGGRGW